MEQIWTSNWTGSCRGERVSRRVLVLNCVLLGGVVVLGVWSNLLVCWLVFRSKTLQTAHNALLLNLASADLLRCLVDSPLFLASLLLKEKCVETGFKLCSVQQFSFAFCSCAQLLSLVSISVDRYLAIAFPFNTKRKKARIWLWILLIWLLSFLTAVLSLTLTDPLSYIMCRHLTSPHLHTDPFGTRVLVPIWTLSIIIITVHYLRIFMLVRQHTNKVFDTGVQPRALKQEPWTVSRLQVEPTGAEGGAQWEEPDTPPKIIGAVCVLTPKARELGKKRVEGKLAKRLGYIIITFILFWLPLVLILIVDTLVDSTKTCVWLLCELFSSGWVMSCIPAALDPLIYTLLQRHFRKQLRRLFTSKQSC